MKLELLTLLSVITLVMAKNIVDLGKFKIGVAEDVSNQKREPKNVVNIEEFRVDSRDEKDKREPKNIVDLDSLKDSIEEENQKREAKNIVDLGTLKSSVEEEINQKRNGGEQVLLTINEEDTSRNLLQTILPQMPSISIISGYIRDNPDISKKTEMVQEKMVIIAPTDDAITKKLEGLKPWEFPNSLKENDEENESIIRLNLDNFLNNHIIADFENNITLLEDNVIMSKLINGNIVKIKQESNNNEFEISANDGEWIKVESVKKVDNGYVFIIDEVLVKP